MSADPPRSPGGQGDPLSRSDVKRFEQALRNDWPIPADVRRALLQTMVNLVLPDDPWPPPPADPDDPQDVPSWTDADEREPARVPDPIRSQRMSIAAMRVVVQLCRLNLAQQAHDLARRKVEGDKKALSLDQITREAEARAKLRIATRGAIGRPS